MVKLITLFSFLTSVVGFFAFAENKDLTGYQKLDMKQFDNVNAPTKDPTIKFSVDCTADSGQSIKASDPRYDECLSRAKNTKAKDNNTNK